VNQKWLSERDCLPDAGGHIGTLAPSHSIRQLPGDFDSCAGAIDAGGTEYAGAGIGMLSGTSVTLTGLALLGSE